MCAGDGMEILKRLEKDHKISQTSITHSVRNCRRSPMRISVTSIMRSRPRSRRSCRSDATEEDHGDDWTGALEGEPAASRRNHHDGNGRWARRRASSARRRSRCGRGAVRSVVRASIDTGLSYLTLYAFSSENWKRPPTEVTHLMGLFRAYFREDVDELVTGMSVCGSSAAGSARRAIFSP